jgi:SAM-dependent methyltransferase
MTFMNSLLGRIAPLFGFRSSGHYWETRYRIGGHSGAGSRGKSAQYKADVLNRFIAANDITSAIEFGCGDGYQLNMLDLRQYVGIDVSKTIIDHCRKTYANDPSKRFILADEYRNETADLALSLDVIYHLVEDEVYEQYLSRLFAAGNRFVVIYATSAEMKATGTPHVRHRDVASDVQSRFTDFVRMQDDEAALPPPVGFDRGLPIHFMLYARNAVGVGKP